VRKGCADTRPFLLCLTVGLLLFDGEDVQVRESGGFCGCRDSGCLLIAIVHFNTPKLDVWTFIAPEIRSDGEESRRRRSAERRWVVE
jgi:hypothetical protein